MAINGVFFDLYGTLLIYGDMSSAWDDWLKSFHKKITGFGFDTPQSELSVLCDGFFSRPEPSGNNDSLTVYEKRINAFCREQGWELDRNQLREVADETASAWQKNVFVDPEAGDVLGWLGHSRKLVLVSNFDHPPHIHSLLAKYQITDYFDQIIVSADVGIKKPDPEVFRIALIKVNLKADEVIHVGDSVDDIDGALNAGIRPVLIKRSGPDKYDQASDYHAGGNNSSAESKPNHNENSVKTISALGEIAEIIKSGY